MTQKEIDKYFLQKTIQLALENIHVGKGGPFAALIVKNNQIIAEGTNLVTSTQDPTAHAEITAIRKACNNLNHFQLEGCTIYSSCEPCPMCLGAIYWARPQRLVFAADKKQLRNLIGSGAYVYLFFYTLINYYHPLLAFSVDKFVPACQPTIRSA